MILYFMVKSVVDIKCFDKVMKKWMGVFYTQFIHVQFFYGNLAHSITIQIEFFSYDSHCQTLITIDTSLTQY